jgi:tRNA (cytidine32/uridine32-2'-O)-methyltransferase
LADALAGCRLVIGSSARLRSLEWPQVDPAGAAQRLVAEAAQGEVALVLGRESSGLTNDELALCHFLVHIPTNPTSARSTSPRRRRCFAYEIRRRHALAGGRGSFRGTAPCRPRRRPDLAGAEEMDGFHDASDAHADRARPDIGYADADQCSTLSRRLRCRPVPPRAAGSHRTEHPARRADQDGPPPIRRTAWRCRRPCGHP